MHKHKQTRNRYSKSSIERLSLPRTEVGTKAIERHDVYLHIGQIIFLSKSKNQNSLYPVNFHVGFDNRSPIVVHDARRHAEDKEESLELERRRRGDGGRHALRIRNEFPIKIQRKETLRIRGGNATDTLNFPYMAAVIINGRLWCAGAIVDENWVLTAAHCLN